MALGHVSPNFAKANLADGGWADPKHLSKGYARQSALSDPCCVRVGQLRVGVPLSHCHATAFDAVAVVVGNGSRPEMRRLYADRSITGVKNQGLVFGDRIVRVVDRMRNDMCLDHAVRSHSELSITISVGGGRPVPASAGRWFAGHEPGKSLGFGKPSGSHGREF